MRESRRRLSGFTEDCLTMILERPIFWLGVAGLSLPQRALLTAHLPAEPSSLPAWRVAKFSEADAWCVSGTTTELLDDGSLLVPDSRRAEPPLKLDLGQVDRPIAFTEPVVAPEIEPLDHFDPASERAVQMTLKKFETALHALRAQFSLGALIHRNVAQLPLEEYHLVHQSTLLAMVDFPRRNVRYLSDVSPVQLEDAVWIPRPATDAAAAAKLAPATLTQVMWQFAQRSAVEVLPDRFNTGAIRLVRDPQVPTDLLKESQVTLLRMLKAKATSLQDLLQQNGRFNRAQLGRDLASLYFDGAIASAHVDVPWLPANSGPSQSALLGSS